MSIESNKNVVRRFNKEVIEGKNFALSTSIFHQDFINHSVSPGGSSTQEGMINFLQNVLWKAFSEIEVEIHEMIGEGDLVTTRKTIHATHIGVFLEQPASGKRIKIQIIDIVRLKDGKYLEHWRGWDPLGVIAQIKNG
jgi:predicted SnoaL-like aldol condensation-catalyzing enzyme